MNAVASILAVAILIVVAMLGAGVGLAPIFGIVLPYLAILLFLVGFIVKVVTWAKSPVPFRIPTTAGQHKSLPWLPHQDLETPFTKWQVVKRMFLEVFFFRSLFRNTKAELKDGPRLVYGGSKYLWLAGLAFHWTFLIIFLRHLRFFTEPVPGFVNFLEGLDGFFEVGLPALFLTDLVILGALSYLVLRRFVDPQVRYISQFADYFPLFLLLAVAGTGVLLRHFTKTDIYAVKTLGVGLLGFSPALPEGVSPLFYAHLFLVTVLIGYFPFSKLMHLGGVFMSPTRNLACNNRAVRHVNPSPHDVKKHSFEDWKKEFAEEIEEAGYKLERD